MHNDRYTYGVDYVYSTRSYSADPKFAAIVSERGFGVIDVLFVRIPDSAAPNADMR